MTLLILKLFWKFSSTLFQLLCSKFIIIKSKIKLVLSTIFFDQRCGQSHQKKNEPLFSQIGRLKPYLWIFKVFSLIDKICWCFVRCALFSFLILRGTFYGTSLLIPIIIIIIARFGDVICFRISSAQTLIPETCYLLITLWGLS